MLAEQIMSYEILEYLGSVKITESCAGFKMRCFDSEEGIEIIYSLYLHRIKTAQEYIKEAYEEWD
jgi:hypothetical protein